MPQQETAEVLVISALINNCDVTAAQHFGLTPDYFEGYRAEYVWLLNHYQTYDAQPSRELFRCEFPGFRICDHEDVRSAVDALFKAWGRRRMTAAMTKAYEMLEFNDLELAWAELQQAEPRRTSPKPRRVLTDLDFLDTWDDPRPAVEMPYPTLQRYTGGIQPGNLWYLAARPGQGKTFHLCNIVKHALIAGNRVRFFSLEMSEDEVRARFHVLFARHLGVKGINLMDIREHRVDGHHYKGFVQDLDDWLLTQGGELDIRTPKDGPVTPGVVANGAGEYHLTVIDYIGLMKADGGQAAVEDWRLTAKISNSLKETGLAASTGILAAAQINREGDHGDGPPKVKNLAQSDALGQDGDVVLTQRAKPHGVASAFSIEKNRHGASGIPFYTTFDANHGGFTEIDADTAENLVIEAEESLL